MIINIIKSPSFPQSNKPAVTSAAPDTTWRLIYTVWAELEHPLKSIDERRRKTFFSSHEKKKSGTAMIDGTLRRRNGMKSLDLRGVLAIAAVIVQCHWETESRGKRKSGSVDLELWKRKSFFFYLVEKCLNASWDLTFDCCWSSIKSCENAVSLLV